MEKFTTHTGIGVPLRRSNVDTDQIIPAVYLKRVSRTGFEDALFAAWRGDSEFVLNQDAYKSGSVLVAADCDALGHFALRVLDADPISVKRLCIGLEESHPAARLLDLDVYASETVQIGRASLGLQARRCLVCDQSAVDCMRSRRHSIAALGT